jgi:hypothetical protein
VVAGPRTASSAEGGQRKANLPTLSTNRLSLLITRARVGCYQRGQAPCGSDAAQWKEAVTAAALAFEMLCMFGQLSPLLGDLKISLLRTGIACSFRPSFGFCGSPPVFFRSLHADALRSLK